MMKICLTSMLIWGGKMSVTQFNIERINHVKDILLRLHQGEDVFEDAQAYFRQENVVHILSHIYEVKSGDFGVTNEAITKLFDVFEQINGNTLTNLERPESEHGANAIDVFLEENNAFRFVLGRVEELLNSAEENNHEELMEWMTQLGTFYHHFNRKEKLLFPLLERYGFYTLTRTMWGDDDRIRTLYKGTKTMMEKIEQIDFNYIKKSFETFTSKFNDMIFQEEAFLLPILAASYTDKDWLAVAAESNAYGYSLVDVEQERLSNEQKASLPDDPRHLPFGGGFLTINEVNQVLNNLPLELTFIDKNGVFKYFNEITESSNMMFVRTPSSIGRHVANCHPPKSMSKVMRLIRDLKTKKKASENMWFKKADKYVHITYKGVFDEQDEFLGILEYVQDIQPFLELPREVKKELSALDE